MMSHVIASHYSLQVRPIAEDEMFRVIRSGKRKSMSSSATFYSFSV